MIDRLMRRALVVLSVALLSLAARVDPVSAQLPARVATPYTLMDDETRLQLQGGVETPLRGNVRGPGTATSSTPGRTSSMRTSTCGWSFLRAT